LVSKIKDRNELINNRNYKSLTRYFSLLNYEQKISMLKQFETSNYTVIPHLAVHLAMDLKRVERFDESNEIVFWVKRHFSDYGFSIEKYFDKRSVHEPIQKNTIGLVLPLSGDKAKFGQKVLLGISLANSELEKPYDLIIRDSQGSSQVASYQIKDLVQNFQVSLIVGGLFSDTAKKQYLTADKLGVTFISLAPVYISKKRKTVLLVEVPGSVESQVAALMASV
jgi:ABC-type branched-subunit amino acid transport system substrate-binding protein